MRSYTVRAFSIISNDGTVECPKPGPTAAGKPSGEGWRGPEVMGGSLANRFWGVNREVLLNRVV
jgi:hypothetical protein